MRVCSTCQLPHDDSVACAGSHSSPDVPGYRIDRLLAARSIAEIYRACETTSGRECQITVVKTGVDDFLTEATCAAGLFHPALADVYDAGRLDDDRCFVAFEAVDGRSLRETLDDGDAPDLLNSIAIVRQVAEALHVLHSNGLVHRAIRPENIILSTDSDGPIVRIQNIDFGSVIAKSMVSDKFSIDSHLDSLRYFAPEQFENADANPQTDVYSLGVVFYEMLAGAPPFRATRAAGLIEQHRNQAPRDIAISSFELRALVSHSLNVSLHKRPESRQSTADLFARQMRHIEQLATHSSTPPAAVTISSRFPTRAVAPPPAPVVPPTDPVKPPRFIDTSGVSIEDWERSRSEEVHPHVDRSVEDLHVATPAASQSVTVVADEPRLESVDSLRPPRSRLNSLKAKLHLMSERVAAETRRIGAEAGARFESLRQGKTELGSEPQPQPGPVRRKIEWVQPEDDIPSVADVRAVLDRDPIIETPVGRPIDGPPGAVQEAQVPVSVEEPAEKRIETAETEKIETPAALPVSVVDEARASATPVFRKKAKRLKSARPDAKPVTQPDIERAAKPAVKESQPAPIVPSVPKVQKVRTVTNVKPISPAIMAAIRAAAKSNTIQRPSAPTLPVVIYPDREEITLVRAPRSRVRIDIDRSTRSNVTPRKFDEISFTPTIIGKRERKDVGEEMITTTSDMFGAAFVPRVSASGLPHKPAAIAAGLIGVVAFFLFGVSSVREFFEAGGPADSVVSQASVKNESPTAETPNRTATKSEAIVKPMIPVKAVATVESKPTVDKVLPRAVKDRPANRIGTTDEIKPPKETTPAAAKVPVEKKVVEKKTIAAAKADPATRPRIVRDPKP